MTMSQQYELITLQDFRAVMRDQPVSFDERETGWAKEYIYDRVFNENNEYNDWYVLRVYSSIDVRTDESRESGKDAIRCVLLYGDPDKDEQHWEPVFKEKRTHRTPGWDRRLDEKLHSLMNRLANVKRCSRCNRVMVVRKNSSTGDRFWGCTGYPDDCTSTDSYDQ